MAKEKQHVFSARTTEEGLKALNEVKGRLKVNWDELVIEAVSAHYNLDKAMMTLPKKEKPIEVGRTTELEQSPADVPTEQQQSESEREEAPAKKKGKKNKK